MIKQLIAKYEKLLEEYRTLAISYEEIENEEMTTYYYAKTKAYEEILKDLKQL